MTTIVSGTLVSANANDGTHTHEDGADPGHGEHYHAADLDGDGRFTDQGEVWPPRPDGAGAPTELPQDNPDFADDPLAVRTARSADVADLLGEQWDVLETAEGVSTGKGQIDNNRQMITYFSYDNNQSVQVDLRASQIINIETIDPEAAQLPLNPEEKARAVDIARTYWNDQGETALNDLEGFSIQAFKPDGGFHDVRMVYVSFHQDADARPDFLTWVDLSNGSVTEASRDEG